MSWYSLDGMFAHFREHNHEPDPRQVERREFKASLKRRVETTRDPLRVVYDQEVNEQGGIADVALGEMEPTVTTRSRSWLRMVFCNGKRRGT